MLKKTLLSGWLLFFLASCASMKNAGTAKKESRPNPEPATQKKEVRFLDQIETPEVSITLIPDKKKRSEPAPQPIQGNTPPEYFSAKSEVPASALQLKYSVLLNTGASEIKSIRLFEFIDEWYGTQYKLGGMTKQGIDCSAFTQFLFAAVYGISLPRTAREQYKLTRRISRTELKEGDLIFFNTRGGISHVGVYLQNNKFIHAAASGGVMISDLFDTYWVRRFVGVGRLNDLPFLASGQ